MKKATKNPEEVLRSLKLKVTKERTALLGFLIENPRPFSIDEIYKALKSVNISTIYRVLDKLVNMGAVYQTDFREGKAYFEYQDTHHHHITCSLCGTKESVTICPPLPHKPLSKFDEIQSHILEFFGICKKCKN